MTISNTPNNPLSAPVNLPADVVDAGEISPPSPLSLVMRQMKEKVKNLPILPMAVTMVGVGLLSFAFISGVPFSLPLLISGAIALGLGVAWLMSSQIAKGLGITNNQDNEGGETWQTSAPATQNEERSASERRASKASSQLSQTDTQDREEGGSRKAQTEGALGQSVERGAELRQENQRKEEKGRGIDKTQSAYLRFGSHQAKLKAFEEKPKAKNEEELPRAARDNLAFDDYYDNEGLDEFYLE